MTILRARLLALVVISITLGVARFCATFVRIGLLSSLVLLPQILASQVLSPEDFVFCGFIS